MAKKSEYKRLVKHFSLLGILKQYPNQLSLGQKQRIAIVRNLLIDSKIYLWDEVSSALDKDNTLKVIEEIDYQIRKSKTFVIVTHDIFFLKELFNRFYYNKKLGGIWKVENKNLVDISETLKNEYPFLI